MQDQAGKEYVKTCVDSVLHQAAASASKERSPAAASTTAGKSSAAEAMERHTATAFNSTAVAFLRNMQRIFPDDVIVRQAKSEVETLAAGKRGIFAASLMPEVSDARLVPAKMFAQQISRSVELPAVEGATPPQKAETKSISSAMLDRDERLLQHCDQIHLLKVLSLRDKYAQLNAKNRDYVWKTLAKLVMCASSVELVDHDDLREVDELVGAVLKKSRSVAAKSGGRLDVKKAAQMVADDAAVRDVSKRLVIHAADGDSNGNNGNSSSAPSGGGGGEPESVDAAALASYIKEVTGKVVDVSGLAGADGSVDLSEAGMARLTNVLAGHGAGAAGSGVRRETGKEAALRERLRARLEERRVAVAEAVADANAAAAAENAPAHPQTKEDVEKEVNRLMRDMAL